MFGTQDILVIWVSNRQLIVMGGKISAPQPIPIPENVISNLEIVDHDALYALIKTWIEAHPFPGAEIVFVFGPDVSYEHVMQESEKDEWETVVVRFLDMLPFEEVESRVYSTVTGKRVVAINKDLYTSLKRGFSLQGYGTKAEITVAELGKLAVATTLSQEVYGYITKNIDEVVKNRLLGDEEITDIPTPSQAAATKSKNNLKILIPVFVVLLGVLGYMIVTML